MQHMRTQGPEEFLVNFKSRYPEFRSAWLEAWCLVSDAVAHRPRQALLHACIDREQKKPYSPKCDWFYGEKVMISPKLSAKTKLKDAFEMDKSKSEFLVPKRRPTARFPLGRNRELYSRVELYVFKVQGSVIIIHQIWSQSQWFKFYQNMQFVLWIKK